MKYNFDRELDRNDTLSMKWDGRVKVFPGKPNVIPMWLADMDFESPKPITDAVQKRAAHPAYGYGFAKECCKDLISAWQERRNGWKISRDCVTFTNGIVPAINTAVTAFTEKGDGVIVQTPVYYPFMDAVRNNFRDLKENRLLFNGERWEIDFDNLEELAADPKTKLLILCSPHNPVCRCFEKWELEKVGMICAKNNVIIFSDEIHSDLVYRHCKHVPLASINEEIGKITLTACSPSKTFNTAGLQMSAILSENPELLKEFDLEKQRKCHISNLFGTIAFVAAYEDFGCEDYLEQLIDYLWENYLYLDQFLKKNMPKIKCQKPEATYLMWLDCTELGMEGEELENFFLEEAGVAFDSGRWFGGDCSSFMRMNIACPKSTLKKALSQMKAAYDKKGY